MSPNRVPSQDGDDDGAHLRLQAAALEVVEVEHGVGVGRRISPGGSFGSNSRGSIMDTSFYS